VALIEAKPTAITVDDSQIPHTRACGQRNDCTSIIPLIVPVVAHLALAKEPASSKTNVILVRMMFTRISKMNVLKI
jgi:hypothetical protein